MTAVQDAIDNVAGFTTKVEGDHLIIYYHHEDAIHIKKVTKEGLVPHKNDVPFNEFKISSIYVADEKTYLVSDEEENVILVTFEDGNKTIKLLQPKSVNTKVMGLHFKGRDATMAISDLGSKETIFITINLDILEKEEEEERKKKEAAEKKAEEDKQKKETLSEEEYKLWKLQQQQLDAATPTEPVPEEPAEPSKLM